MKAKFIYTLIALLVLATVVFAFRQENEGEPYLMMTIYSPPDELQHHLVVIGENRIISDEIMPKKDQKDIKWYINLQATKKINELYRQGYKLISSDVNIAGIGVYHFEKK